VPPPAASPAQDLQRLERALGRAPQDRDGWLRLDQLLGRLPAADAPEVAREHLPWLVTRADEDREEPAWARLVLRALGLDAPEGGASLDPDSGLPERAVRRTDRAEVVLVPGGTHASRRPELDPLDDRPHLRWSGPVYLDVYPVTVRRYAGFLAATGHRPPLYWRAQAARPGRPVVFVDLADVVAYGHWAGGRPPREAEWERAASASEAPFPWGDGEPDETRVHAARGATRPDLRAWDEHLDEVDSRPGGASPRGVRELMGNACQWCLADDGPYPPEFPAGPGRQGESGPGGVMRGSSWHHPESRVLVSDRRRLGASTREGWLSFRLVTSIPGDEDAG
jgi:formylglycine-generating enzyme required for sulfatase activity